MLPRRILTVAVAIGVVGCVGLSDRINHFEMAPRLAYQGFSFERPPNQHWYILRHEQTYTDVMLRREMDSATHSFYASVSLSRLERQPTSHQDFFDLARSTGQKAPYSVRELSREEKLTTVQNQWCVRTDTVASVRGAPAAPDQELQLIVRGYRCLHPAFPEITLDFFYSERGLPSELNAEIAAEGEQFLRGVRIDIAPGTPAS